MRQAAKAAPVNAIIDAPDAHQAMSSRALGSERIQSGIKDVLLGLVQL